MPGGNETDCSTPSFASVSGVTPAALHRPEFGTYVSVAGSVSVSWTLVAAALPVLKYDSVIVIGPWGDGPLVSDIAFVTLITEFATVVVSVLVDVVGFVSETETVICAVLPLVAPAGTVPATTKRNVPPAAIGPVAVTGVELSGTPSPLASM